MTSLGTLPGASRRSFGLQKGAVRGFPKVGFYKRLLLGAFFRGFYKGLSQRSLKLRSP